MPAITPQFAVVLPPEALTVIIRDDGPMIHCGDSPSYRTVRVALTESQRAALALRQTHAVEGVPYFEQISRAIIED